MSTQSLTYRQRVFKWQQSNKHFKELFPQDGAAKTSWNEMASLSPYVLTYSLEINSLLFWPAGRYVLSASWMCVGKQACVLASNTHADYDARPFTRLQCRCTRLCRQRCGACRDCKLRALLLLLTNCSHDQSRLTARLLNRHWRYNRQAYLMNWWLGSRVVSACWTQAQKGPGSNRSRDAVG